MKKLKAELSARDFELGGVHRGGWWASFFGFLIPLIEGRLIQFGKSIPFGKSQGFPELYIKRNRILWILAERYNILSVNSVEKWGFDESRIQFGKTSYYLAKAGSFAK